MSAYRVRLRVRIVPPDDGLDQFTDQLMEELAKINEEPDLGGSLASGVFDIWVTVKSSDPVDAVQQGTNVIRTAGHAAGASTHGWPRLDEWPTWMERQAVEAHLAEVEHLVPADTH